MRIHPVRSIMYLRHAPLYHNGTDGASDPTFVTHAHTRQGIHSHHMRHEANQGCPTSAYAHNVHPNVPRQYPQMRG